MVVYSAVWCWWIWSLWSRRCHIWLQRITLGMFSEKPSLSSGIPIGPGSISIHRSRFCTNKFLRLLLCFIFFQLYGVLFALFCESLDFLIFYANQKVSFNGIIPIYKFKNTSGLIWSILTLALTITFTLISIIFNAFFVYRESPFLFGKSIEDTFTDLTGVEVPEIVEP